MKSKTEKSQKEIPLGQRTIAIIGTSRFKGRNLLMELESDPRFKQILVIDRKNPNIETKKTKFYKLDLTETLADVRLSEIFKKEKVHTIIHMATPTTPPRNQALGHEIVSVGSMYICNACADAGVKKMILASTTDVYGAWADNPNFLTEEHSPRGGIKNRFIKDKVEAEKAALNLAQKHPEICVTILRPCAILGPSIQSFRTRYLSRPIIATIMGYDPLVQFVHETDVIRAFMRAIEGEYRGIFNIVGPGVLPLSRVIGIMGKVKIPLPEIVMKEMVQLLWYAELSPAPASYLNFLKYLCIADGEKAQNVMGFIPRYSTRETLLSFVGAERLREVDLSDAEMETV